MSFEHTVTVERDDEYKLRKLVSTLDLWCSQHYGLPSLNGLWHRNRHRFYSRKGQTKRDPKIYYTIYNFKEAEYAFEFKLAHM